MIEQIEGLTATMEKVGDEKYIKLDLSSMEEIKPPIDFDKCHIAISQNGGLMAFVRKSDFLLMDSNSIFSHSIRIFCQNGSNERRIKFETDKKDKYIVLFQFDSKERLYCIFKNGTVIKFDIFTSSYIAKSSGNQFLKDSIISAKLFENGFVALTKEGFFYVISDIKDPIPTVFYDLRGKLGVDPFSITDYAFISPKVSSSSNLELVYATNKSHGLFIIVDLSDEPLPKQQPQMPTSTQTPSQGKMIIPQRYNKIYHIRSTTKAEYSKGCGDDQWSDDDIGFITSIVFSPRGDKIAFYRKEDHKHQNAVFVFKNNLETNREPRKALNFNVRRYLKEEKDKREKEEILTSLSFGSHAQFLWCGDEALCVCSDKYVSLVDFNNSFFKFKTTIKRKEREQYMSCISEIDGLRIIMNDGVFFINKVSEEFFDVCYFMSESPSKRLVYAYNCAEQKLPDCDGEIRAIRSELSSAVKNVMITASQVWNKEIQMILLKAAQHGKDFLSKDDFNFNEYVNSLREIRIVNNLRQSEKPRLITFAEYQELGKELVNRLIQTQEFFMAEQISKELMLKTRKVYQKWATSQIKALPKGLSEQDELDYYKLIQSKVCTVPNISYIKLAKKAFKYNKQLIGIYLLENEKSVLTKIPQYIQLKKWNKALELALDTYDSNVIFTVIDKIFVEENLETFRAIMKKHKKADTIVLEYLKRHQPNYFQQFLEENEFFEQSFYWHLELFFKSNDIEERFALIRKAKTLIDQIALIKDSGFDTKYYKTYIGDIEESIKLKKDLIKEDIIKENDINPFDIPTIDLFESIILEGKFPLAEKKNAKFDINPKLMSLLRIRTYGKLKSIDGIIGVYKNELKKSGLSNLHFGELFVDIGDKLRATECLTKVIESDYFEHKIELLKSIEKYKEVLEIIISTKYCERKEERIDEILQKDPKLKAYVVELCTKHNVVLEKN